MCYLNGMTKEIMNTREVAGYLGLNEKRIYQLAKQGEIPATRIGGKWIFPRALMNQWILERARGNLKGEKGTVANILVVMGSNDIAWDIISHTLQEPPFHIIVSVANVGSTGGLIALEREMAHAAGIHLFDPESGLYNIPFLEKYLPGKRLVVIHLFKREQGLIVRQKNLLKIEGIRDLSRQEIHFVNRQKGSGTRILLDFELQQNRISPSDIHGYHHEVDTHMAVAMEVLRGKADCGLGVYSVAKSLGLGFIPVKDESYDLVVLKKNIGLPQVKSLFRVIRSEEFSETLKEVGGYDLKDIGKQIWEGVA